MLSHRGAKDQGIKFEAYYLKSETKSSVTYQNKDHTRTSK